MHPVFAYPKSKHQRSQIPPTYRDYKRFKPHLREEFDGRCVYCRAIDRIKGQETFGVDHYRPKSLFPDLACEYLNLFYCCNRCNSLKRSFWPNVKRIGLEEFIPNPCEHVMFSHLRYIQGEVTAVSAAGDMTLELLDLNDPDAVNFRGALIKLIDGHLLQINRLKKTIRDIKSRITASSDRKYINGLALAESKLEGLFQALEHLIGSVER